MYYKNLADHNFLFMFLHTHTHTTNCLYESTHTHTLQIVCMKVHVLIHILQIVFPPAKGNQCTSIILWEVFTNSAVSLHVLVNTSNACITQLVLGIVSKRVPNLDPLCIHCTVRVFPRNISKQYSSSVV